jgi:hypothetical protein
MPTLEELEHRVARLEALLEEVIMERLNSISQRLDQLYEKTERDKTEILSKMAQDKSEILSKTEQDKTEILSKVADVLIKTEKDKREIIYWVAGLLVGFATLLITAIWALLSFAIKP